MTRPAHLVVSRTRGEERQRKAAAERGLVALMWTWTAELARDDALATRVLHAFPESVRLDYEESLERWKVRLVVEAPDDWWRCDACYATFDVGEEEAVVIRGSNGPERSICITCVTDAAAALDRAG